MEAKFKNHQHIRESLLFFLCCVKVKVNNFIAFYERLKNESEINTDDHNDDSSHTRH